MTSQRETNWKLSAKGNWWRRMTGKILVVGQGEDDSCWAMVEGRFLEDHFDSIEQAQSAAERRA